MFSYKIVMVGDFGVGKTSLVRRFVDNSFSEEYLSSIGVCISKKNINDSLIMLWDIEGKTELKPIFNQYLNGAKGFIIVGDVTRISTIESISKHIQLCQQSSPDAPIIVSLNKKDIKADTIYSKDKIKKLSSNIILVIETSAKSGDGVSDIFSKLDSKIVEQMQ
jgi:small GTP-binding protein